MRALTGHEVEPTLTMREARAGDRYLLCSDGLSDLVSDETIAEALQIPDVAESADRLIELALRGGGPDNVTVVVADVVDHDYGQTQPIWPGRFRRQRRRQPDPPNTAAGRASAIRPRAKSATKRAPPRRRSRRRRAPRSGDGLLIVSRWSSAGAVAGLARRPHGDPQQLLRRRRQRHGVDHAGHPGSLLGYSLHQRIRSGCLNSRNECR